LNLADGLLERVRKHFDATAMNLALEAIWSVLGAANKYFSAQEPWVLRKSDETRFRTVLYTTLETVRIATLLSQPVMPESTGRLLDLLGQTDDQRMFAAIGDRLVPGTELPAPVGVFPRIQVE
jgi:methionyl-tRNA synthetase